MKKFKNGLCLGKFMPVHNGHIHLIESAIKDCESVHIMVCSLKNEPIDGYIRYQWMLEIFGHLDNVNIIWCQDENPQYENECETLDEFYSHWIKSVYSNIDKLDSVFTSESYGDDFARYLNVEHVLVDIERKTHPVSGTMVRTNPKSVWEYIPNNVKNYYL